MSLSILSFKPGHDGTVAHISNGRLEFSLESEKDSFPRYSPLTADIILQAFSRITSKPDVLCISGWVKGFHSVEPPLWAGYYGTDPSGIITKKCSLLGSSVDLFSSSHERSHILCGYGLSPYAQGQECYSLVWEGNIGSFYEVDSAVRIKHLGRVLEDPGNKYSFLFAVGDPDFPSIRGHFRFEDAGKLMALAGYSDRSEPTAEERVVIEKILSRESILLSTAKEEFKSYSIFNSGVRSKTFKALAGKFSDAIFDRFWEFAKQNLTKRLPLIITGGCGLNCEWNSRWRDCGLFPEVFVPPCTNDTGSAIGTAIDAQLFYGGSAKVDWNVYSGTQFERDIAVGPPFTRRPFSYENIAELLYSRKVLAWVQGKYEMGPRALGNRSILSSPFDLAMRDRLNEIKQREDYRPIAPVCLESDVNAFTTSKDKSPHMLYFYTVSEPALKAVTHVDGSARFQTVNENENKSLFDLLSAFKALSGVGVLCNTSLNFRGRGFINRTSDLIAYCQDRALDGFVVGDEVYVRS